MGDCGNRAKGAAFRARPAGMNGHDPGQAWSHVGVKYGNLEAIRFRLGES